MSDPETPRISRYVSDAVLERLTRENLDAGMGSTPDRIRDMSSALTHFEIDAPIELPKE
jgi:hypothetical protein